MSTTKPIYIHVKLIAIILLVIIALSTTSCSKDNDDSCSKVDSDFSGGSGTFTDPRDGVAYKWVKIGTQIWMAENLKATKYNDGSAIPNVTDQAAWESLKTGAYCYYANNALTYGSIYGCLYNWYAVNTGKLAPKGWHAPTDGEWATLSSYLGGDAVAGGKLKEAGTTHWNSPNIAATNSTGFSALPGGGRGNGYGFNSSVGVFGCWWSSTPNGTLGAWGRYLYSSLVEIDKDDSDFRYGGGSVRCIKDN